MAACFWVALGVLAASVGVWLLWLLWRVLGIACGVTAKAVCTGVFVCGRPSASDIVRQDLSGIVVPRFVLRLLRVSVDRSAATVTCTVGRLPVVVSRTAVFARGGATLLPRGAEEESLKRQLQLQQKVKLRKKKGPRAPDIPLWLAPQHRAGHAVMSAVLRDVFGPQRRGAGDVWGTRAVVVVHGGRIVAESYGEGFSRDTPLPVWSVTKSLLNALVAARVRQGRLRLSDAATAPDAAVALPGVTVADLMRMRDVLMAEENAYPLGALQRALFEAGDAAASALSHGAKPAAASNGWRYSSCVANVLSRRLRDSFDSDTEYRAFAHNAVFDPAGMCGAALEYDASGTAVASSFSVGTARDWARFGMLYLPHSEVGASIFPPGWLDFTSRPAPGSCGGYGALWWLGGPTAGAVDGGLNDSFWAAWPWRAAPAGTLIASGLEGQAVVVVPSHDLVVVRLGRTPVSPVGAWHKHNAQLVCSIVEALSSL